MEKVGVFFILLIAIALSGPVFAEINPNPNLQGTLSMGIAIPAGITVKYWPNSTNAFDFKPPVFIFGWLEINKNHH